jgi:hypothetical protein
MLLTETCKFLRVNAAVGAGTNTITTDVVDMAQDGGFDGVAFLVNTQTLAATTDVDFVVQAADASDFTGGKDVSNGTLAIADDDDNHLVVIDVQHPPGQYVALTTTIGTANAAFGEFIAVLYRGHHMPVAYADDATTIVHQSVNGALADSLTTQGS